MVGQVQTLQANLDKIKNPAPTTAMSTDQIIQELQVISQESQNNKATMMQQQQQIQRIQESYKDCVPSTDHDNQIAALKQNLTELQQQVREIKDKLEMSLTPTGITQKKPIISTSRSDNNTKPWP